MSKSLGFSSPMVHSPSSSTSSLAKVLADAAMCSSSWVINRMMGLQMPDWSVRRVQQAANPRRCAGCCSCPLSGLRRPHQLGRHTTDALSQGH